MANPNIGLIIKEVINESLKTIRLQLINGYFYPTNSISRDILHDNYNLDRIPMDAFDRWSPKFVRDGFKMAIDGYDPKPTTQYSNPNGLKIGGAAKAVKNPCTSCKAKGLCDKDECGRKTYRLFSNK